RPLQAPARDRGGGRGRQEADLQGGGARARPARGRSAKGHGLPGPHAGPARGDGHGHAEGPVPAELHGHRRVRRHSCGRGREGRVPEIARRESMDSSEIIEKYRKYLYGLSTYYKEPLP